MDFNSKKILIFSLAYNPFIGGAEVAIGKISELLPQHKYLMITSNLDGRQKKEEVVGNIMVYRVGGAWSKYFFPILAYKKALEIKKTNKIDFVWAMMANQAGLAALFFKLKFPQIGYLLTLQEGDSEFDIWWRTWFIRPLYRAIYKRADYIQAISYFLADRAKRLGAVCPIEVVPNGIDLAKIKLKQGNASGTKIIITTSRLVKKNGLAFLIKSVTRLINESKFPIELQILGEGKLLKSLKRLTSSLGVASNVQFVGSVSNDQVYEYLSRADIFARPSLSEGLGNSFLEAMACGLPVVGTPVGGIVDFLHDGKTGWLAEPGNIDSLTEKLQFILAPKNQFEVERISAAGQEIVKSKYSWTVVAQSMQNIFNKVGIRGKRVLFCTGIYPPEIGGPAIMIKYLVADLEKRGFDCHVLTYASDRKNKNNKEVTFVTKGRRLSRLIYLTKLLVKSLSFDVVYVTDTYSVGYFAWLTKKITGKKYIVRFAGDAAWETATANGWTNDYITDFAQKKYDSRIEKMKARRQKILADADIVIAVSNFMGDLAEMIGVDRKKIEVIYNSVDFIGPTEKNIDADFQLPHDGKIIMTACRLTKWKGVDFLLRVLPAVKAELGKVYLVVLGDGPEMLSLKKLAQDLQINDYVIFLDRVSHEKVMEYYRQSDIFVLNTNYEGLSHTLLEVMRAGVPIIATNVGGNPEVIENNKEGLLIGYGREMELREAIIKILINKKMADSFVAAAAEKLKFFNWENTIKETIRTIKRIV